MKKLIFEIGGKNKTTQQLSNLDTPAFLIKDDIVVATNKVIPLLYLGFIY